MRHSEFFFFILSLPKVCVYSRSTPRCRPAGFLVSGHTWLGRRQQPRLLQGTRIQQLPPLSPLPAPASSLPPSSLRSLLASALLPPGTSVVVSYTQLARGSRALPPKALPRWQRASKDLGGMGGRDLRLSLKPRGHQYGLLLKSSVLS